MRLDEITPETDKPRWEELARVRWMAAVRKDCSEFLKHMPKDSSKLLFRGGPDKGTFMSEAIREDRRPRDSTKSYHDVLNQVYKEQFGIEKLREKCVFVSGAPYIAEEYGTELYIVFPTNGSEFINVGKADSTYLSTDLDNQYDDFIEMVMYQLDKQVSFLKKSGVSDAEGVVEKAVRWLSFMDSQRDTLILDYKELILGLKIYRQLEPGIAKEIILTTRKTVLGWYNSPYPILSTKTVHPTISDDEIMIVGTRWYGYHLTDGTQARDLIKELRK